jgi:hypothetical protein
LDDGEFQKARIRVSPNDQRSTRRHVLVVSANDPPQVGATDSEEVRQIQANANRAERRVEEQRQAVPPCARDLRLQFEEAELPTFNSPQANLGAVLARLQQANPSPEADAAMAYVRITTALRRRGVRRPSRRHLRRAGTRAVDPIGLRIASSPQSKRR